MAGGLNPTLLSPQTTKSGAGHENGRGELTDRQSSRASAISPACTSATRTVGPPTGPAGRKPGRGPAHPITHPGATAGRLTRHEHARRGQQKKTCQPHPAATPTLARHRLAPLRCTLTHGRQRCRTAPLHCHPRWAPDQGGTARVVAGTDNSRCANHPAGSHSTQAAASNSIGPALVTSQYWVAAQIRPYPSTPAARLPRRRRGPRNSSGTKPNQAQYHQDGAGKAGAGIFEHQRCRS